ncbi:MAG: 5'-3' exonuclease H3TH domain-containing protein, partial [bacterium]
MSSNKTNRKRFFILDGYALLYRAHFGLIRNPLITSYGLHTSALFGFVNQVLRIIKSENPDYIACAFDSKEKTFRHDMYKEYKANRSPMPDEMQLQLPHLWEMLEAMNLPVLKKPGVEADDIIGTLAVQAEKEGLDTYIVSGDKDFMQLMNDHIFMFAPGTRKTPHPIIYNSAKVEEKWGVPPNKIIDLLGLMGDSSDNVPGVAGVGEKTAVKLIKTYGSLEGALENADKVTNKRAHNGLKDGVENAILSKELVTILTDVELSCDVGELEKRDINIDACVEKFTELEFHAILKQLVAESNVEVKIKKENVDKNYNTILTEKSLNDLVKSLKISKWFSFALETTSIHAMKADIVGLSFSNKADSGWYIPIQYLEKEKNNFGKNDLEIVLEKLKPILEDDSIYKTGQNIKYDSLILKRCGVTVKGIEFDTMIAAHLLNPAARSLRLDTLSLEHLNYEMVPIEELIGKGRNQITIDQVPLEKVAFYSIEDADIVFQLTELFKT